MTNGAATENAFLGALVGMAIGDALGVPLRGMSPHEIAEAHPDLSGYVDLGGESDDKGMISEQTEIMLCIVESMTTNAGRIDAENINARLGYLIESPSRDSLSADTIRGVEMAFDTDGFVPEGTSATPELGVASRGIAIGLVHAVGEFNADALRAEASHAARLTHGDADSAELVAYVADAVQVAARGCDGTPEWDTISRPPDHALANDLAAIVADVRAATKFEDAVLAAVKRGGDTASAGAIAGGVAGALFGAAGLPQHLIDDLDARIYLSMAAPWFFRSAMMRSGNLLSMPIQTDFRGSFE